MVLLLEVMVYEGREVSARTKASAHLNMDAARNAVHIARAALAAEQAPRYDTSLRDRTSFVAPHHYGTPPTQEFEMDGSPRTIWRLYDLDTLTSNVGAQ